MATVPRHIAIIMDGNGRWAKKRLMPRSAGHYAGLKRLVPLVEHIFDRGVEYVTLYALSTENLKRPQEELDGLYSLFRKYFLENVKTLVKGGVKLKLIGDLSLLPKDIEETARSAEKETEGGTRGTLVFAIAYGARQEILSAVNKAVRMGKELTEEEFKSLLYTAEMPDPDLLIRTGKEQRISNFLLFQSAYTEFYYSDKMFPEFSDEDLDLAIEAYETRDRRYGKVK